jgi:hypothetical protein
MKRWIAVLLFANVAVYAYLHLIVVPTPPPAPTPSPHPLRLADEPAAASAAPACRSIGPLHDADVAQLVADWLKGAKRTATERTAEAEAPPSYWVITTRKSAALALRLVQQLRTAGVTDVEAVPPDVPDGETRVSLGVYPERARAERRILDLKGYSLAPAIVEQPRRAMQWWLDVEPAADGAPIDVAALLHAVPAAAGAALSPCVLSLPPADAAPDAPDANPSPAPVPPAAPPKKSGAAA